MQVQSLDVRLLAVFAAIARHKSLTLAAESLGLTQPALSQSLAKLRKYFNDPLFVRTPHGMEPTPRAQELSDAVDGVLETVKTRFERPADFDPVTATRAFGIFATDLATFSLVPAILKKVARIAPNVRLRTAQLEAKSLRGGLESGDVDLAIGVFPDFGGGMFQQRLYRDTYICVARAGNPLAAKGKLTRESFLKARHVIVSAAGTGHGHSQIEKLLTAAIRPENISMRVASFLAAPYLIRDNDLMLCMPKRSGTMIAKELGLKLLPVPLELPEQDVHQYWHERFHHDPAHKWFRGMLAELFMAHE